MLAPTRLGHQLRDHRAGQQHHPRNFRRSGGLRLTPQSMQPKMARQAAAVRTPVHHSSALENLDYAQHQAASCPAQEVLVEAGPGSGKTGVMAARVAWLAKQGVQPCNILAMTFTRKATKELEGRLQAEVEGMRAYTFHSFCISIINKYLDWLDGDLQPNYELFDDTLCRRLLTEVIAQTLYGERDLDSMTQEEENIRDLADWLHSSVIRMAKETEETTYKQPNMGKVLYKHWQKVKTRATRELVDVHNKLSPQKLEDIFQMYQRAMRRENAVENSDLVGLAVYLLQSFPDIRAYYQEQYKHVLVDEFQDINQPQYALINLIKGKHNHLFAVGDADQAIYGWRGANPTIMTRQVLQNYPNIEELSLNNNYRSASLIVDFAQHLRKSAGLPGADRSMYAMRREYDDPLRLCMPWTMPVIGALQAKSEEEQAEVVRALVQMYVGQGYKANQVAVLYRANKSKKTMLKALMPLKQIGISVHVEEEDNMVQTLKAYLQLALMPDQQLMWRQLLLKQYKMQFSDLQALDEHTKVHDLKDCAQLLFGNLDEVLMTADEVQQVQAAGKQGQQLLEEMLTNQEQPRVPGLDSLDYVLGPSKLQSLDELRRLLVLLRSIWHHGSSENVLRAVIKVLVDTQLDGKKNDSSHNDKDAQALTLRLSASLEDYWKGLVNIASDEAHVGWSDQRLADLVNELEDTEDDTVPENTVSLMTMHKAKGLEWPVVIVPGWDDGCYYSNGADADEEQRLMYMAVTRAQRSVVVITNKAKPAPMFQAAAEFVEQHQRRKSCQDGFAEADIIISMTSPTSAELN